MARANGSSWLFGATSVIGYALVRQGPPEQIPFAPPFNRAARKLHWPALDVADTDALRGLLDNRTPPSTLVYAHAVCTVKKCEANPDWAWRMNVTPIEWLVKHLPGTTRLVYISSDHVFGNDGTYDEHDVPRPISCYARTRLEAERRVLSRPNSLVVRPGLAIGPSIDGRTGHYDWLAYRSRKELPISIVEDEARSAVWADDLATRLWALIRSEREGVMHQPATQTVSRVELAQQLMAHHKLPAVFNRETRAQQPHPHLGQVTLASGLRDPLTTPLPSVVDRLPADVTGMDGLTGVCTVRSSDG